MSQFFPCAPTRSRFILLAALFWFCSILLCFALFCWSAFWSGGLVLYRRGPAYDNGGLENPETHERIRDGYPQSQYYNNTGLCVGGWVDGVPGVLGWGYPCLAFGHALAAFSGTTAMPHRAASCMPNPLSGFSVNYCYGAYTEENEDKSDFYGQYVGQVTDREMRMAWHDMALHATAPNKQHRTGHRIPQHVMLYSMYRTVHHRICGSALSPSAPYRAHCMCALSTPRKREQIPQHARS
jgi:hypothetical protein